jgi:ATP-dependent Lon protease
MKYIETLLEIPWLESTEDVKDISLAEKILQDEHTGLKDVKERILEFLAVKFRNGNSKGNIICLHGPPGVGKTSIAKSIAKALGK